MYKLATSGKAGHRKKEVGESDHRIQVFGFPKAKRSRAVLAPDEGVIAKTGGAGGTFRRPRLGWQLGL